MEKCFIVDGKMDFSRLFFHGLFFSGARNSKDLERMALDKILMHGEIVPRNRLSEILTEEEKNSLLFNKYSDTHNGMDCVCLATKKDTYNNWISRFMNESDRAFPLFCAERISIIISPQIFWDYECYGMGRLHRDRENRFMNGEIQVKGAISKEYFQGVSYYQYYTNSFIEEILKNDLESEMKDDLLKLTESDFLKKYFSKQIMIEELLNKYGYNIEIFDIETGEQFPSIEEEKEIIHSFKKYIK